MVNIPELSTEGKIREAAANLAKQRGLEEIFRERSSRFDNRVLFEVREYKDRGELDLFEDPREVVTVASRVLDSLDINQRRLDERIDFEVAAFYCDIDKMTREELRAYA